jgi:hypothetical protein
MPVEWLVTAIVMPVGGLALHEGEGRSGSAVVEWEGKWNILVRGVGDARKTCDESEIRWKGGRHCPKLT